MYSLSNKYTPRERHSLTHTYTQASNPCAGLAGGKQGGGKQLSANPGNEGTPASARGKKKWMERKMYGES